MVTPGEMLTALPARHPRRAEDEWLRPVAPGGWARPRGAAVGAAAAPVPAVAPAPARGRPCISGRGLPLSEALQRAGRDRLFRPIKRVIGRVLYEILSPKASSCGRCGTSSLFQQLGPALLGFQASDVCVAGRGCALARLAPDGCPCRREPGPWWVPHQSPNRSARGGGIGGGIGGGGPGDALAAAQRVIPTYLPPLHPCGESTPHLRGFLAPALQRHQGTGGEGRLPRQLPCP